MSEFVQIGFIRELKEEILRSRYQAAKVVNSELIKLYFRIGQTLDQKMKQEGWGAKVLDSISNQLQQELPGLKGFSSGNIRRMRRFYNSWEEDVLICSTLSNKLESTISTSISSKDVSKIKRFYSLSFSHHYEIILEVKNPEERWFYIDSASENYWSVRKLRSELKNKSHLKIGTLPNNFSNTLDAPLSNKAIQSFKDEYLLDFVNLEDPDDQPDERVLEQSIVQNIKKFLMSLGNEFSFLGNQYRLQVEESDYFIDLLFYHRGLQALIAIELKKGKFKPEYAGKMNFYLSALDDLVKLEHENPSIGIILCKEKENKIVEYSFRDIQKPMGVSVFKTSATPPDAYKNALPDPETLKKLMD